MSTWDSFNQPRATDGRFAEKHGSTPEISLLPPAPSAANVAPEDTIDELFGRVMWRSDGSFVGTFDDRAYAVRAAPEAVYVVDEEGSQLSPNDPMHQAVCIALGRFSNDRPVPPPPVRLDRADGRVTQVGALYDGWERADVVGQRVTNRVKEAVSNGEMPPFEYSVRTANVGTPQQSVEVFIEAPNGALHTPDGQWTRDASLAYHGALNIAEAWNRKTEGGWAPPERTYTTNVRLYTTDEQLFG
jgi:hypothetical protein